MSKAKSRKALRHLKKKLIEAGRGLAHEGQGDYVAGHITVRVPDASGHFLMKPAGIGIEEMNEDNIIVIDADGAKIGGDMPRHNEVFIHSEVLRARPDANAVIHTHPSHVVAFSSLGKPLLPVVSDATLFEDLPIFDETTDLIIDAARGAAVARRLGKANALILRNHGIVTCGATIEEAVYYAIKLDKACRVQLYAEWAGGPKLIGNSADTKAKGQRNRRQDLYQNLFNYVCRCCDRAEGRKVPPVCEVVIEKK
ncbi:MULTISPECIES: class II aldolase/adducin family protein [unclassified Beijerinckia]|uniref:class II aldolase/adducin family protein n=1 Tax=unclassified Beijerinckia TaxID=2638183 RepID=UPI00089552E2|nr:MULTISPECIES: class II aldolase/adducin family protein [unclassified Beijerinckia]MDH7798393.1 ribulose-5-phosphate 4-epimerase/fuculose-1-phosphate aldolase [Beijerinckia sp. GAS462]SED19415.1 L-fuculose-phosphate aldolase [Beijerinckia sp. 28-YEA-48]